MSWESLAAVAIFAWLVIALVVGTVLGRGIGFGNRTDSDSD
jgi:hypothetical protein